jgi:hypothetical protein
MEDKTVYPTHTCFSDTMETLLTVLEWSPDAAPDLFVVHALCRAPEPHTDIYAHAWLEDDKTGRAITVAIYGGERMHLEGKVAEYRATLRIIEMVRYSVAETIRMNREHGDCGPWVPAMRAACSTERTTWPLIDAIEFWKGE